MPEAPKSKPSAETSTQPAPTKWWKSFVWQRWLLVLIIGSLVVHGVVFALVRKSAGRSAVQPEYTVGTFSFVTGEAGDSRTAAGKFDLHVRFLDELDVPARQRIVSHQFRVRESIEGLLRGSQGLNLDDSALTRLKHQIQEHIDDALDLRAVAEVMITDLTVPAPAAVPPAVAAVNNATIGSATPTAATSASTVAGSRVDESRSSSVTTSIGPNSPGTSGY